MRCRLSFKRCVRFVRMSRCYFLAVTSKSRNGKPPEKMAANVFKTEGVSRLVVLLPIKYVRKEAIPQGHPGVELSGGCQIAPSKKPQLRNGVQFSSRCGPRSSRGTRSAIKITESINFCAAGIASIVFAEPAARARSSGQISCARCAYCSAFPQSPTARRPPASWSRTATSAMSSSDSSSSDSFGLVPPRGSSG